MASGTDASFREQHYQDLVKHYYCELEAALTRLGLSVEDKYPKEDFEFELKQKLPYGLIISGIGLPVLTADEEDAPPPENFNLSAVDVRTGELYQSRINEIVEDYVKWGIFTD